MVKGYILKTLCVRTEASFLHVSKECGPKGLSSYGVCVRYVIQSREAPFSVPCASPTPRKERLVIAHNIYIPRFECGYCTRVSKLHKDRNKEDEWKD